MGQDASAELRHASQESQPDTRWLAAVHIALPPPHLAHPALIEQLNDELTGRSPAVKVAQERLVVGFALDAKDLSSAQEQAGAWSVRLLRRLDIRGARVTQLRVATSEELERARGGYVPDLVGVGETASILGVSKQRVHQLTDRPDFPDPIIRVRATPLWEESEIRLFDRERKQRG